MTFNDLKKKYGLSNAEMARIFGLKNAVAYATSSAKTRMKKTVENLHEIFTKRYDFKLLDKPDDYKVNAIGLDESGNEVAYEYHCDKPDCQCCGSWYSGNPEQAESWVVKDSN